MDGAIKTLGYEKWGLFSFLSKSAILASILGAHSFEKVILLFDCALTGAL